MRLIAYSIQVLSDIYKRISVSMLAMAEKSGHLFYMQQIKVSHREEPTACIKADVKEVHNIESGTCCMFRSDAVISER